ncbi:MAG TPA: hypothetical protein VHX88_00630 [Solirubrobacteraceae bacterium]|jgi:chromosome segregation ATPase|nr:hypothetical protein [Solirubrobacteraceae bacterium]
MAVADDRVVAALGRRLTGVSGDVVGLLRALPEIAAHLRALRASTEHMDDEVTGMHAAVRDLRGDLDDLKQEIIGLREEFQSLDERLERIDERVDTLTHPFRRRGRLREDPSAPAPDADASAA